MYDWREDRRIEPSEITPPIVGKRSMMGEETTNCDGLGYQQLVRYTRSVPLALTVRQK